ncbi:hypothetical protein ACP3WW_23285, partial [Salmonella enterica]|uniref:hypothetical protein n=1 Tax=Salmonella enterica TaxID=28901 RepID=UPI003CE80F23
PDLVAPAEGSHGFRRLINPLSDAPPGGGASRALKASPIDRARSTRGEGVHLQKGNYYAAARADGSRCVSTRV